MRVLIIEDEQLIAWDAKVSLAAAGCEVTGIVGSVEGALHRIAEDGYDVAILDADLKGLSSEPVAAALRENGTPFVVMSGYAIDRGIAAFADAPFLGKPCKPAVLVAAVLSLA